MLLTSELVKLSPSSCASIVNMAAVCVNSYHMAVSLVLALDRLHEGHIAPSIRIPVVDDERMWLGKWLKSVLCVSVSALTLLVG